MGSCACVWRVGGQRLRVSCMKNSPKFLPMVNFEICPEDGRGGIGSHPLAIGLVTDEDATPTGGGKMWGGETVVGRSCL